MMEKDDHMFDKIIRDKLSPYEEPVPDDVWANISSKRDFLSLFKSHYILIGGVSILLIVALTVTISMTFKTKKETETHQFAAGKIPESGVLVKQPVTSVKPINTKQFAETKAYKSEESNERSVKTNHQPTISLGSVTINKSIKNSSVKTQNKENIYTDNHQRNDRNEIINTPVNNSVITNPAPLNTRKDTPRIVETAYIEPIFQTTSALPDTKAARSDKIVNRSADTQSEQKTKPEIITGNASEGNVVVTTQAPISDSNALKQSEILVPPANQPKVHFSYLDFIVSPGYITKSTKASNPASESYARMLNRVTTTKYSIGFEIRYRYYLNPFWNIATGLIYNQVKEQMNGQVKPEQMTIKQTPGMLISPFDPPKHIIIYDTFISAEINISQNNTFSYIQIPALLGANFCVFKIPFNLYAGAGYFISIKQQGAYINSATLESVEFQSSLDNPYKNNQGLSIMAGINSSIQITKRSSFFVGVDYSRYVIALNDQKYQIQQYYSILNLNLGITYQLF